MIVAPSAVPVTTMQKQALGPHSVAAVDAMSEVRGAQQDVASAASANAKGPIPSAGSSAVPVSGPLDPVVGIGAAGVTRMPGAHETQDIGRGTVPAEAVGISGIDAERQQALSKGGRAQGQVVHEKGGKGSAKGGQARIA